MFKHGAINFFQNIFSHYYFIVRTDADYINIKSGMMNFTKRQAIWDNGIPFFFFICNYMSSIEQFIMVKPAETASCVICYKYSFAKSSLV